MCDLYLTQRGHKNICSFGLSIKYPPKFLEDVFNMLNWNCYNFIIDYKLTKQVTTSYGIPALK